MAVLKAVRLLSLLSTFSYVQSTVGSPILGSILGPIKDVVDTIGSGAGLIEGTLGGIKGVLGVQQR
jgi:hypothetical protein